MSEAPLHPAPTTPQAVRVSAIDISFGQLVAFFIKAGLAAIPAILIITLTIGLGMALLRGMMRFGFWSLHGGYGW